MNKLLNKRADVIFLVLLSLIPLSTVIRITFNI